MARRKRGQRQDDDDGGDFSIPLGDASHVPSPTMELETADLKEMGISGEAKAKPNLVIQTGDGRLLELQPGWSQDVPKQSDADDGGTPTIIVDDGLMPQPAQVQRVVPKKPRLRTEPTRNRGGVWLIVLAYLLAGTALGLAIYERFIV